MTDQEIAKAWMSHSMSYMEILALVQETVGETNIDRFWQGEILQKLKAKLKANMPDPKEGNDGPISGRSATSR